MEHEPSKGVVTRAGEPLAAGHALSSCHLSSPPSTLSPCSDLLGQQGRRGSLIQEPCFRCCITLTARPSPLTAAQPRRTTSPYRGRQRYAPQYAEPLRAWRPSAVSERRYRDPSSMGLPYQPKLGYEGSSRLTPLEQVASRRGVAWQGIDWRHSLLVAPTLFDSRPAQAHNRGGGQ